jgi:phospholipase C
MQSIVHAVPVDSAEFNLAHSSSKIVTVEVHSPGSFVVLATGGILTQAQITQNSVVDASEQLLINWKLSDPDGRTIFESSLSTGGKDFVEISMDMLNRVRDLAGFIRQPWQLTVTNPLADSYVGVKLNLQILENILSSSASPLFNKVSVNLAPGTSQVLPFALNRLGQIRIDSLFEPAGAASVELLDPSGSVVATRFPAGTVSLPGTISMVSDPIGLTELHRAQKQGAHWGVRLSAIPTAKSPVTCFLTAEVYDYVSIPAAVLQTRLDAVFGKDGTSITLSSETQPDLHDPSQNDSYIVLTINAQDVVLLLDNIGVIDTLESLDRSLRRPPIAAPLQPADPVSGTGYRIANLGPLSGSSHDFYLKNFKTEAIKIVVGAPAPNAPGQIGVSIVFAGNPVLDIRDAPDLEFTGLSVNFSLMPVWMQDTKHISLVPEVPAGGPVRVSSYNWNDSPDWIKDPKSLIAGQVPKAMDSFGVYLKSFTESLFFQFMGGLFDFTQNIQFTNDSFVFQFISGEEDPVGALNPFYHPGAPSELISQAILPSAQSAQAAAVPSTPLSFQPGPGLQNGFQNKPNWHSPNLAKIDHIVVLMKENRSFDHVLGHLSLTGGRSDIDGLTPGILNAFPAGSQPRPYPLVPVSAEFPIDYFPFDPDHSFFPVARQIDNPGGLPMHGFIPQFLIDYPFLAEDTATRLLRKNVPPNYLPFQRDAIMGYHTPQTVPYYSLLAENYTVCDRWFSSHPGPTFPNRFFFMSGKLDTQRSGEPQRDNGISGLTLVRHRNLFDELTARGITWTYYESPPDVTMLRMYARYAFDDQNIRPIAEFYPRAHNGQLPSVTFIDPNFHYGVTNDDHPPTSILGGQAIMQEVVEALQANTAAWGKTLFIFTYDEHGSIFDHVVPFTAETLSDGSKGSTISTRYGVRVPAIIISPWVEKICTHTVFDHCSILKTILARFCPDDPPILSDRVAFANDLGPLLTRSPGTHSAGQAGDGTRDIVSAEHAATGVSTTTAESSRNATEGSSVAVMEMPPPNAASSPDSAPGDLRLMAHMELAPPPPATPEALIPRASTLSQPNSDWHSYMARLSKLVKP